MAQGKFVSYLRVSTARQGASGLGLDAQRSAVTGFLNGGSWDLVAEVVEVESGANDERPKLAEAMAMCRVHGATLLIAKLDRLSRDAHFLLGLQKAGVRFVAADMPQANELTIGLLAVVAQHERQMISARTKAALAAKRAKLASLTDAERDALRAAGKATTLGGNRGNLTATIRQRGTETSAKVRGEAAKGRASDLAPVLAQLRAEGVTSLRAVSAALNTRGIPTARGGQWTPTQVSRLLAQVGDA
ncbi:recombinase family protein [Lichenibacterium dinghuense]|uniref:recombinase family protein n=1 Tax=Lichenibacterium dinghuense TaxID=2895977 RepID=UPI001F2634FE|nr:recombinase family protein [Lichenibacterium sp. 6Y81]